MSNKIYIIGIGYRPFDKRTKDILLNSSIILASSRLFEVFKGYEEFEFVKDRIKIINNVDETIEFIKSNLLQPFVLLASGDPMFFGIGRRVIREFGKDSVEIIPDLSSIQLAFSRIKEPWDDAFLMSLHGGPDPLKRRILPYEVEDLPWLIEKYPKIAILTDRENNPSRIASALLNYNEVLNIHVCEKLGYPDERIISGNPAEIRDKTFRDPNVVIILKKADDSHENILFGLQEAEFFHSRGLITKDEVRAITIHKLRLPPGGVFWDIGSGSGSISIEVSRLCPELKIYAVEKDKEQIKNIEENKRRYRTYNLKIIEGEAPEVLKDLPLPDRIFIGGSGGRLRDILEFINSLNWSGIIVINATTLETIDIAFELLKEANYTVDVVQVHLSRLKPLGDKHHFSAQNPVFIITGHKKGDTVAIPSK